MIWLASRQLRANALAVSVCLVGIVVVLVVTRPELNGLDSSNAIPSDIKSIRLLGTVLIAAPAFMGAFWGAPLVAHELESGTYRLAWTQSVTRQRWLAVKLVVLGFAAAVAVGVFTYAFTWWSLPLDDFGNRLGTANFGQRGIAPIAYTLFALALGTCAGALLRRTIPAMAATIIGFAVVRFSFQEWVRAHLAPTVEATVGSNVFGQISTAGSPADHTDAANGWVLSRRTISAAGQTLDNSQIDRLVRASCHITHNTGAGDLAACAHRIGIRDVVTMHRADQFWTLQTWEAASFVALAALLVALTFWSVRRLG
jgi:hypothetical protein